MKNLKTKKGREKEMQIIEGNFLFSLINNGFDVCPTAVCTISKSEIELGIAATGNYKEKGFKMDFASEIRLQAKRTDDMFGERGNEINFGSSGSFDPSIQVSYWRTVHAASILKDWKIACHIVNKHCKMYADLEKEIFELNKDVKNEEATA